MEFGMSNKFRWILIMFLIPILIVFYIWISNIQIPPHIYKDIILG